MDCEKVQLSIPDLWITTLSFRRREAIETHLIGCVTCNKWYAFWKSFRVLGQEQIRLPRILNWKPFNSALDLELKRNPRPRSSILTTQMIR